MMAKYGNAIFLPEICRDSLHSQSSGESRNHHISDSQILDIAKGATSASEKRLLICRFDRKHLEHVRVLGKECRQAIQAYQNRYSRPLFAGTSTTELDCALNHEYYLAYITYRAVNQVINDHGYYNSSTFSSISTTFSNASTKGVASNLSCASNNKLNGTVNKHLHHRKNILTSNSSNISVNNSKHILNSNYQPSSPSLSPTSSNQVPAKSILSQFENGENGAHERVNYDLSSAHRIFRRLELIYPSVCSAATSSASASTTEASASRFSLSKRQTLLKQKSAELSTLKKCHKMAPGRGEKKPAKGRTTQSKRKVKVPKTDNNTSATLDLSALNLEHHERNQNVVNEENANQSSSLSTTSSSEVVQQELDRRRQFLSTSLLNSTSSSKLQPQTSPLLQRTPQIIPSTLDNPSLIFRDVSVILGNKTSPSIREEEERAMAQFIANQQQKTSFRQSVQTVPILNLSSAVEISKSPGAVEEISQTLDTVFQEKLALVQSNATLRSKLRHLNELMQSVSSMSPTGAVPIYNPSLDFWAKVQRNSTSRTFNLGEIPKVFLNPSTNVSALTRELDQAIGEVYNRRYRDIFSELNATGPVLTFAKTSTNAPIQNQSLLNLQYLQNLEQESSDNKRQQNSQLPVFSSSLLNPSRDAATTTATAAATITTLAAPNRTPDSSDTAAALRKSTLQRTETTLLSVAPRTALSTPPTTSMALQQPPKEPTVPTLSFRHTGLYSVSNTTSSPVTAMVAPTVVVAPSAAAASGTTISGTVAQFESQWQQPSLKGQLQRVPMAFSLGTAAQQPTPLAAQPPSQPPSHPMQGTALQAEMRPRTSATCSQASDQSDSATVSQMNHLPNPRQLASAEAAAQHHQQQQQQQLFAIMNHSNNNSGNNNAITHSQLLQLQLLQSNFLFQQQQHQHQQNPQQQPNTFNPLLVHTGGVLPSSSASGTTTITPFLQSVMISSPAAGLLSDKGLPAEPTIDTSLRLFFGPDANLTEQQRQLFNGANLFQLQQQQQHQHKVLSDIQDEQPENLQVKKSSKQQQKHQLQHPQHPLQQPQYLFPGSLSPTNAFHLLNPQHLPPPQLPPSSTYSMESILSPFADSGHPYHHLQHQQPQPQHPHCRPEKIFEMSDDERSLTSSMRSRVPPDINVCGKGREAPGATSVLVMAGKPSRSSLSSSQQQSSSSSSSSSSDSIESESLDLSTTGKHSSECPKKRGRVIHCYSDSSEVVHSQVGCSLGKASNDKESTLDESDLDNDAGLSQFVQNSTLPTSGEMLLSKKKTSAFLEAKDLRISKHKSLSAIANLQDSQFHQKAVESTKVYIAGLFGSENSPVSAENLSSSDQITLNEGGSDSVCVNAKSKDNDSDNGKSKKNIKKSSDLVKNETKSEISVVASEPVKSPSLEKKETKPQSASVEYFKKMLTQRKTPKGGIRGKKIVIVKESFSSSSSSDSSSSSSSGSSDSSDSSGNSSSSDSSSDDDSDNESASKKGSAKKVSKSPQKPKTKPVKPKNKTILTKNSSKTAKPTKGQKRPINGKDKAESAKKKKLTLQKTTKKKEAAVKSASPKKKTETPVVSSKKVGTQRRTSKLLPPLTDEERQREEQAKRDEEYARLLAHEYWEESRPGRRAKAAEATSRLHEIFTRAKLPMEVDAAFQLQQIALMDAKTKHDEVLKMQQQQQRQNESDDSEEEENEDEKNKMMRCTPSTSRDALGQLPSNSKKVDAQKSSSKSQDEKKPSLSNKSAKVEYKTSAKKSAKKDSTKASTSSTSQNVKKTSQSSSKQHSSTKSKSSCKSSVQQNRHNTSSDDDDSDSSDSSDSSSKDSLNKSSKQKSSLSVSLPTTPPPTSSTSSPPKVSGKAIMMQKFLKNQHKKPKLQNDDSDSDDNDSDSDNNYRFQQTSVLSCKISPQPSTSKRTKMTVAENIDSDKVSNTKSRKKKVPKKKRKKVICNLSTRIKSKGFLMTTPYDACPKFVWFFRPLLKEGEKITINRLCKLFWQYIQENNLRFKRNNKEYIRFTKRMCRLFEYDYLEDDDVSHNMGNVGKNLVKMHIDFQKLKNDYSTLDEGTDTEADRLRREQVMKRFMVKEEDWNEAEDAYDDEIPMAVIDKMRRLRHINNELSDSDDDDDNDYFNNEDSDESCEKLNELAQKWIQLKKKKEEMENKTEKDNQKREKQQKKKKSEKKSRIEAQKLFSSNSKATRIQDQERVKNYNEKIGSKATKKFLKTAHLEQKSSKILPKLNKEKPNYLKSFTSKTKSNFKVDVKDIIRPSSSKAESSAKLSQKIAKSTKSAFKQNQLSCSDKNKKLPLKQNEIDIKSNSMKTTNKEEMIRQHLFKPLVASISSCVKILENAQNKEKDTENKKSGKFTKSSFVLKDNSKTEKSYKSDQLGKTKSSFVKTETKFSISNGSYSQTGQKKDNFSNINKHQNEEEKKEKKGKEEKKSSRDGFNTNSKNSSNKRRLEEEDNRNTIKKNRPM